MSVLRIEVHKDRAKQVNCLARLAPGIAEVNHGVTCLRSRRSQYITLSGAVSDIMGLLPEELALQLLKENGIHYTAVDNKTAKANKEADDVSAIARMWRTEFNDTGPRYDLLGGK